MPKGTLWLSSFEARTDIGNNSIDRIAKENAIPLPFFMRSSCEEDVELYLKKRYSDGQRITGRCLYVKKKYAVRYNVDCGVPPFNYNLELFLPSSFILVNRHNRAFRKSTLRENYAHDDP
jgi:hypothetical protein